MPNFTNILIMESKIKSFFNKYNTIPCVDNANYKFAEYLKQTSDALVRVTGLGIYIFDYFKQEVYYLSDNLPKWFDIPADKEKDYEYYLQFFNSEDLKMLFDVNNAAFEYWNNLSDKELIKYTISYDFRFKGVMVNQHYTPVLMSENKVWMGMCIVSLSSQKTPGHIMMETGNKMIYEYSLKLRKWIPQRKIVLTDREKALIRFSAQGYSVSEIAEKFSVSSETIKTQKKVLYKKLNVCTMTEAVSFVVNNCLL